ncbi:uncharacterized protein LOC110188045 [Drosophila serrata]|uniref:uncharacterized protein LOC110188045 n=1 Tax=Drosophila serrata TaxID=7274 RepID=UPI000A1CF57C|nr:uncharacterized protein LOC110188045 [Drosophila serrata]
MAQVPPSSGHPGLGAYSHDDDDPRLAPMACPASRSCGSLLPTAPTCHGRAPFGQQLSYSSALTNRELSRASGPGSGWALGQSLAPVLGSSSPILQQPHNGHDDAQI